MYKLLMPNNTGLQSQTPMTAKFSFAWIILYSYASSKLPNITATIKLRDSPLYIVLTNLSILRVDITGFKEIKPRSLLHYIVVRYITIIMTGKRKPKLLCPFSVV